jgi:hypothetical protein
MPEAAKTVQEFLSAAGRTLTRLAALGPLSRDAGEGGPSPPGLGG